MAPASPQQSDETPAPAQQPAPPQPDAAAALYDLAFEALAVGRRDLALQLLEQLQIQHPEHRLAARAAELRATLASTPPAAAHERPSEPSHERPPEPLREHTSTAPAATTGAARAELLFFQTVHGIALGAETCVLLDCEDARLWAFTLMLGGGAGFGLSLHLSSDGITPGLSRALTSGTLWGLWHGAMLGVATGAFESADDDGKTVALALGLGQLSGLALGGVLYAGLEPTAGQVSLASSGGIWSVVATGLGVFLFDTSLQDEPLGIAMLVASDIGLLAGGYFASRHSMSAGRVLLLDAGGVLGTLGGVGFAVLMAGENRRAPLVGGFGLIGMISGIGLAYHLTADWDEPDADDDPGVALSLSPTPDGVLASGRVVF